VCRPSSDGGDAHQDRAIVTGWGERRAVPRRPDGQLQAQPSEPPVPQFSLMYWFVAGGRNGDWPSEWDGHYRGLDYAVYHTV